MSTRCLWWSISIIESPIDRCLNLCRSYPDESGGTFPRSYWIQQLEKLNLTRQRLAVRPNAGKIYINLEAIVKTLGDCQVFLQHHRLPERTDVDLERNADLIKRLKLHSQVLEVYGVILKR